MIHPCPTKSPCLPGNQFLGADTPFANLSAEAPDIDLFLGSNFGWDQNVPRLGWIFTDTDTPAWCRGTTQQLADICAQNNQLTGQVGTWKTQNNAPPQLFFNQQVTCPFTCPDGLLFVWTVPAGTFQAMDQSTANSMAQSFACSQALRFYICMGSLTPSGCVGTIYNSTVTFTGGKAPIGALVISGVLPPGLLMSQGVDGKSFSISGTPTAAGNYTFSVMATDANGNFMVKTYTLQIVGISNITTLQNPTVARAYSAQLTGAGGTAPYTFALPGGPLPTGLSLSASGAISGTPSVHYSDGFSVPIQVTDANNFTCTQSWNGKVLEPPGPDWTTLTWDTYTLFPGIPANFVAGQGSGPGAFGAIVLNTNVINPKISPVHGGGVTYTGPQVTANIHLVITDWNTLADLMTFRVLHSVAGQIGGLGAITGPGTYDFNFTVPASVGASITVDDGSPGGNLALVQANQYVGVPIKLTFTLQIFNT